MMYEKRKKLGTCLVHMSIYKFSLSVKTFGKGTNSREKPTEEKVGQSIHYWLYFCDFKLVLLVLVLFSLGI